MAAATAASRPYQLVVWGASGFTGKLVCEHIARDYQGKIRWALAGRDQKKLEGVRSEISKINPDCQAVPILVADPSDGASVGGVLRQAQVVVATAGPFAKYGNKVLEQSLEQGTHYCDITGEVTWVRRSQAQYHAAAEARGVKLVHCCGYDSIPSDLGTLLVVDHIKRKLGKRTAQVYHLIGKSRGGVSGGTIASVLNMMSSEPAGELAKAGGDAYYLAGAVQGSKPGSAKPAPYAPLWNPHSHSWLGPFVMEGVNARVVHLSNALASEPYGSDLKYTEMVATGPGLSGWALASGLALATGAMGLAFWLPPTRALAARLLPSPGSGPSLELQRSGYWNHTVIGVTEEEGGRQPTVVRAKIGDRRDPGYWSTSRMLLEAGLTLALEGGACEAAGCRRGGVLTPASAMGLTLVERLRAAGFTFQVLEEGEGQS